MPRFAGLSAIALAVLLGCASTAPIAAPRGQQVASPSLLFDRQPGPFASDDFAYRAGWPAAPRPYDPGQTLFYVEFVYDIEGRHGLFHDQTRREFRSYRTGLVRP